MSVDRAPSQLDTLEFGVRRGDPRDVTVPPWRMDVTLEDDLVEEVARSIGYDQIPEAPLETHGVYAVRSARELMIARARNAMIARGLTEAQCTTLISEGEALTTARLFGDTVELIKLRNPMSREGEVLRPNPVAGLLRACAHNLRQGREAVRLFEVGAGFTPSRSPGKTASAANRAPERADQPPLPDEVLMLGALVTGPRFAHAHDASQQAADFLDARGLWDAWLEEMRVDTPVWRAYAAPGWKLGASAEVASGTSRFGWGGTLSQGLLREWEIESPVHVFVALLDPLADVVRRPHPSVPGRFPPVRRDLAFFVPEQVTHDQLERLLRSTAGEWLSSIELFDVYTGPGTPSGMKSMAFALQFRHPERTLTESEIQTTQDHMVAAIAKECGGRLRER